MNVPVSNLQCGLQGDDDITGLLEKKTGHYDEMGTT